MHYYYNLHLKLFSTITIQNWLQRTNEYSNEGINKKEIVLIFIYIRYPLGGGIPLSSNESSGKPHKKNYFKYREKL